MASDEPSGIPEAPERGRADGDRVDEDEDDLVPLPTASRNFALPDDFKWLATLCHELRIEITPPW